MRRVARKKKIVKLREKDMPVSKPLKRVERKEKQHFRPLLAARDAKKLEVFNELKKQRAEGAAVKPLNMSKGKKRRLQKKQRV